MALMNVRTRFSAVAIGLALSASGCGVHKQEAPSLTGPSVLGTAIVISASPDVLTQDGASQSLVTIAASGSNGQPLANLQLRADIAVGGVVTDFGKLSAKSLVTDASGRATVVYTAPAAPALVVGNGTKVDIQVTPLNTTNADNVNSTVASIMLVPAGIIGAPPSPLVPNFTAPAANVGDTAVFSATVVDATGANAVNQVSSFQWNFGDGGTANGQSVTHTFTSPGSFPVTLTITDALGRTAFITQSLTVGQGQVPTAAFVTSPNSPIVNQTINFNASGSTAAPGHTITTFAWNFGDGTLGDGALVQHSYPQAGTYTVTLKVTDDAGRKSSLTSQTVTVGNGNPTADFAFNPSAPTSGQQVVFDASASQAQGGRTIVSYSWSFGDGGSGSGQTVTHTFTTGLTATTYNVLLTVTDSAGKVTSITKPITINP
jgi:PKD repeat protein